MIVAEQSFPRPGEAEAIALASELKADWTLLDERDGRRVAKSLGLKVTGILGILLRVEVFIQKTTACLRW
jgi:predicted nucleic acid-binding protein